MSWHDNICEQYILKYPYVIKERLKTTAIVIRRVTEIMGIRRVTIYKTKSWNTRKIYIDQYNYNVINVSDIQHYHT